MCVILLCAAPLFLGGGGGGIYIIVGIYICDTLDRLFIMSNLNMDADFHAYLETLGCTEAEFKSLSLVDRSSIHLNLGDKRCQWPGW